MDNPAIDLQHCINVATRTLAGRDQPLTIRLQGSHQPNALSSQSHYFVAPPVKEQDTALLRGTTDRLGLVRHGHNPTLHGTYVFDEEADQAIFNALEMMRIELYATRYMDGSRHNMHREWLKRCEERGYDAMSERADPPLADMLRAIMLQRSSDLPPPTSLTRLLHLWAPYIERAAGQTLDAMASALHDQRAFSSHSRMLLKQLRHQEQVGTEGESVVSDESSESASGDDQSQQDAQAEEEASALSSMQDAGNDGQQQSDDAQAIAQMGMGVFDQAVSGQLDQVDDEGVATPQLTRMPDPKPQSQPYTIYSTQHDEIIYADTLVSTEEAQQLRQELDRRLQQVEGSFGKLSSKLQRLLMAQQQRYWSFDCEEGRLDSARLARLVTNPLEQRIFKIERDTAFRDTVVTLLLDNSGSMRGRPITIAALSSDILARVLERAGVKVEILGFTTKEWKGGKHYKAWVKADKPPKPGRLNDLRHIIYKSADTTLIRARRNLGVMLKEGLLKENIDGEALLWAYHRLKSRPEARRIMMVISDGAPVDDATLSANTPGYLDKHLRQVISTIQHDTSIELCAVGIGHDVTRYYEHSVKLSDVTRLGETMTTELVRLFTPVAASKGNAA